MSEYFDELKTQDFTEIHLDIIDLIGFDAFEGLSDCFGASYICIPSIKSCLRKIRHRKISEDYGIVTKNKSELARMYNVSVSLVYDIISGRITIPPQGLYYIDDPLNPLNGLSVNDLTDKQKKIAECIGFENFIDMIRKYDGMRIRVPYKKGLERHARNRHIADSYTDSTRTIEQEFDLSRRQVRDILKSQGKRVKTKKEKCKKRNKRMRADLKRGMTRAEIAKKYGLSKSTVKNILLGEDKEKIQAFKRRSQQILTDFESGMTYKEIASKFGVTIGYIGSVLVRERRKRECGEAKRNPQTVTKSENRE